MISSGQSEQINVAEMTSEDYYYDLGARYWVHEVLTEEFVEHESRISS